MQYTIDIPKELVATIKRLGYDINSYFDIHFVQPLMKDIERSLREKIIKDNQIQIDDTIKDIKQNVSIKKLKVKQV